MQSGIARGSARRRPYVNWAYRLIFAGTGAIIFLAAGCGDDGDGAVPSPADTPAGTETPAQQPTQEPQDLATPEFVATADATPGVVTEAADVRMTFNEVMDPWAPSGDVQPAAGFRFVAFHLSMRNMKQEPYEADIARLVLIDANGAERGTDDMVPSTPFQPTLADEFARGPIEPDTFVRGWIAFEIEQDLQISTVRFTVDAEAGEVIEYRLS